MTSLTHFVKLSSVKRYFIILQKQCPPTSQASSMYALALPQSNRSGCPQLDTDDAITSESDSVTGGYSAIGFSLLTALNNEFLQVYVKKIEGFKDEAGFMDKAGASSDASRYGIPH
jgi:hypothetical protein